MRPGDVVLHYDGTTEAIVGVSVATGTAEPAPIHWVARGSYARRAGEQARWLPGTRVPLRQFSPIDPPVTLAEVRQQQAALLDLRAELEAKARGRSIYFPWVPYGEGPIRTFQSYLVKVPQVAISLFPRLRQAVDDIQAAPDPAVPTPVELMDDDVAAAAGRAATTRRGQGYLADQALRTAIESRAMNAAIAFFSAGWQVEDVHARESYDLRCRRGDEVKYVEVKGTTMDGGEVILTPNEVAHARAHPETALFVLSGIIVLRANDGSIEAAGGTPKVLDPGRSTASA